MKKMIIGLISAATLAAGVYGAAASLGGLTSESLGSDDQVVIACDVNGVDADYNIAYDGAGPDGAAYYVSSVTVSDIDPGCAGNTIRVALADAAGASLSQEADFDPVAPLVQPWIVDNSGAITVTVDPAVRAELVENNSVAISGN